MNYWDDAKLEVRDIAGKGRGIVTKTEFKKGDIIFCEEPFVSCQFSWNKSYGYLACDHCMRPLELIIDHIIRITGREAPKNIPYELLEPTNKEDHVFCDKCGESYCSEICKNKAAIYHENLCFPPDPNEPLFKLNEAWKKAHYPPETASIMLLARIISMLEQAEDKPSMYQLIMNFCNLPLSEDEAIAKDLLHKDASMANIGEHFVNYMKQRSKYKPDPYVDKLLTMDGFIKLLALMKRNGQGVGTSALAVFAKKAKKYSRSLDDAVDEIYANAENYVGDFLNNEGAALYKMHDMINHSCVPNAQVTFPYSNNTLALLALTDIKCGQEILISYLDECTQNLSRHTRQKIFRKYYYFTCVCQKCIEQENDPDITSDEEESDDEDAMETEENME